MSDLEFYGLYTLGAIIGNAVAIRLIIWRLDR